MATKYKEKKKESRGEKEKKKQEEEEVYNKEDVDLYKNYNSRTSCFNLLDIPAELAFIYSQLDGKYFKNIYIYFKNNRFIK